MCLLQDITCFFGSVPVSRYKNSIGALACAPIMCLNSCLSMTSNSSICLLDMACQASELHNTPLTNIESQSIRPISSLLFPKGISERRAFISDMYEYAFIFLAFIVTSSLPFSQITSPRYVSACELLI